MAIARPDAEVQSTAATRSKEDVPEMAAVTEAVEGSTRRLTQIERRSNFR
jgi:hypothetical protein